MGEIADMMLDGTLCQGCGEYIDDGGGEPAGVPQYCAGCAVPAPMHYTTPQARRRAANSTAAVSARKPFQCGTCRRRFGTEVGLRHHQRDVHQAAKAPR